jgi:uncharacterized protein (DUF1778 family)
MKAIKAIYVRVTLEEFEKIKAAAKAERRSVTSFMTCAALARISDEKKQNKKE